jgi:hypothetical protein
VGEGSAARARVAAKSTISVTRARGMTLSVTS